MIYAHDDATRSTLYGRGGTRLDREMVLRVDGVITNTYYHGRDDIGADLGYGDGVASAHKMMERHGARIAAALISNGRRDRFAEGYLYAVGVV